MIRHCIVAAVSALAFLAAATAAQAGSAPRAWVSGHGADAAGCGAPTNPCRSLQYAIDNIIAAGGEIDILDPAGYGAVFIGAAVSIINDGVGTAGVQTAPGEDGVLIDAGPTDAVILRGLDIEGLGVGAYGVRLAAGGSLSIEDCTIDGFGQTGVEFTPEGTADLYVSNTRIANTAGVGVYIGPNIPSGTALVHATLERLEAINDGQAGVMAAGSNSGPGVNLYVTVADSLMDNNATDGVHAFSAAGKATTFMMVRNTTLSNNSWGASAEDGASLYLANSTISGNTTAFFLFGTGAVLGSYGDNDVVGNGAPGPTPSAVALH